MRAALGFQGFVEARCPGVGQPAGVHHLVGVREREPVAGVRVEAEPVVGHAAQVCVACLIVGTEARGVALEVAPERESDLEVVAFVITLPALQLILITRSTAQREAAEQQAKAAKRAHRRTA